MAAPVTPEDWLPVLTKRLDDRRPRIDLLRSYVNGEAPLPEAGANVREAWKAFQRKARTNFGALVIDALSERIVVNGVMVGASPSDDDRVRRIWRENRLDIAFADAIRDALTVSIGYMVLGRSPEGRPVITAEQPEFMYAATDPLRPWISRAAVKVWRDVDAEFDYAFVWANQSKVKYERPAWVTPDDTSEKPVLRTGTQGGWTLVEGSEESYSGDVPVVVFENHDSMGEFEPHTDILDRINKGNLDRLVTMAMQAFRQRALKGGLPATDEEGKPIDYAAMFNPSPGALWDLPQGIEMWESQESSQSILAMLQSNKDDIRDFAAVTRTPLAMLVPEGANQSAAGSEFAKEGLVMKARDRIARFKPSLDELLERALRVEQPDFADVVETAFADPTNVSTAEKYDAAVKAKAADVPFRTVMTRILGFTADEVDRMEVERAAEQVTLEALLASAPQEPAVAVNANA
jgi:Phage portal protein, SPP1 Gp6-like